jgi:hypothetical protein
MVWRITLPQALFGPADVASIYRDVVGQIWMAKDNKIAFSARLTKSQLAYVAPDITFLSQHCIS